MYVEVGRDEAVEELVTSKSKTLDLKFPPNLKFDQSFLHLPPKNEELQIWDLYKI